MKIRKGDYLVITSQPKCYHREFGRKGLNRVKYPYYLKVKTAKNIIHGTRFGDGEYGWWYEEGYPIEHITQEEYLSKQHNRLYSIY